MRAWAGMAGLLVVLTGCVTMTPEEQAGYCDDIEMAMSRSPEVLRVAADTGNAHAQMAWSIVLRYGLNGVMPDPAAAQTYRWKATASRGQDTTFVWISATKKTPGYLMPITNYRYDIWPYAGQAVDQCVGLLANPPAPATLDAQLAKGVCGGQLNYDKLKAEWQSVSPH